MEYASLFLIPGPRQTFPFETCYREGPSRADARWSRRMLGFVALQVQRAYVQWGMPADLDSDEFPDHAGVELRFMARLVQAERAASKAPNAAFTRAIVRAESAFLAQHILQWFPDWLQCVRGRARRPFYRTVAELLGHFLGSEKALFGLTP
jgi:TorA maturation chaperone TorD